jgi:hypothetical protein
MVWTRNWRSRCRDEREPLMESRNLRHFLCILPCHVGLATGRDGALPTRACPASCLRLIPSLQCLQNNTTSSALGSNLSIFHFTFEIYRFSSGW